MRVFRSWSPTQKWAANVRFLDRLIARGDQVHLATNISTLPARGTFAREVQYLLERGYTIGYSGWRLLPPRR